MSTLNKHLRLASYNIRKAKGLDRRRDPARILKVLNGLDADVVALQEADFRLGDRPTALCRQLINDETDFEVMPLAANDVSLGWHGNAVLVRKGLSHSAATRIPLSGLEPRGAVRIDIPVGTGVSIVATHLGLIRRNRREQLATIAGALSSTANSVVMGDFNEWSLKSGLEPLSGYDVHSPGRTFHAARPVAALDRIAVSSKLEVRDMGVVQDKLARRASDHLPIWADIAVT